MVFRRDLRAVDNTALDAALSSSDEVVPCFIFNEAQVGEHPYRSDNGLCFMIESLEALSSELQGRGGKLFCLHGKPSNVVKLLIESLRADAIFLNKDYTPFSRDRDRGVAEVCLEKGVDFRSFSDLLLVEPSTFGKADGTPYSVFTPFFKRASKEPVRKPASISTSRFFDERLPLDTVDPQNYLPKMSAPAREAAGGRNKALVTLDRITEFSGYTDVRNFPSQEGTTALAPHNKFGTVSIREVYWRIRDALGESHDLIRQLYWRDFFTHVAWHFPHVFEAAFNPIYNQLEWGNDEELLDAWQKGRTGFPIVDAGMRQLVATGFMHNRVRMIVASFLVKDLLIDWHEGERFFARHLTEYDPAVNNGNWQWAASTGCDAQPYFRIFNPWIQQKKFDPDADYIRKWVPELKNLTSKQIHTLDEAYPQDLRDYLRPIVDHKWQKKSAEQMFAQVQPAKEEY